MNRKLPPGPPSGWLGLRHSKAMRHDVLGFYSRLHQEFGDIAHFHLGPHSCYLLTHPEHIHDVLIRQAKKFRRSARFKHVFGRLQGDGTVTGDGERWARHRRIIQPAFQPAQLAEYCGTITQLADQVFDRWPSLGTVDFAEEMRRLTLRIVAQTLFSTNLSETVNELSEAVETIQSWGITQLSRAFPTPRWLPLFAQPQVRRAFTFLNAQVARIIRDRRKSSSVRGDLLDHLLNDRGSPPLSDREVHQEVASMLVVGHETTAVALTWTVWLLARHQDIQDRIAAEVGRLPRPPAFADLSRLSTIEQAFREATRLYPPIYVLSREIVEPVAIGGYEMQPKSLVFLSPYLTQRDPRWFPDPDRFDPTRFTSENESQRPACSWFPFGTGPRGCIGRSFAQMEASLILACLVQRYRLEPIKGQTEVEPEVEMLLRPKGGLRLTVVRREEIKGQRTGQSAN